MIEEKDCPTVSLCMIEDDSRPFWRTWNEISVDRKVQKKSARLLISSFASFLRLKTSSRAASLLILKGSLKDEEERRWWMCWYSSGKKHECCNNPSRIKRRVVERLSGRQAVWIEGWTERRALRIFLIGGKESWAMLLFEEMIVCCKNWIVWENDRTVSWDFKRSTTLSLFVSIRVVINW